MQLAMNLLLCLGMLTLKNDRSNRDAVARSEDLPKYIKLELVTTIGRASGSDVRFTFPWLSRKHATVRTRTLYQHYISLCSSKHA